MIVLAYLIVGGLSLTALVLERSRSATRQNNSLSTISIIQAIFYLGITLYVLIEADLPVYYLSNRYIFIDALGAYEAFISSIVFLLAAVYARGYVAGLLEHGEIDRSLLKLFYGSFGLLQVIQL